MSSKRAKKHTDVVAAPVVQASSKLGTASPKWLGLLLVVAGVAVYFNSLDGVFLFDDLSNIVERERIRSLLPVGPLLAARRPVVELSLAVNYALGGLDPRGYHIGNIVIHILAGLTLFGVVRRTLLVGRNGVKGCHAPAHGIPPVTGKEAQQDNSTLGNRFAFTVALLWLVHPLQTESVTYLVQRAESLMGFFYLGALYCMIRGAQAPKPLVWYTAAVASCALGMGSKGVMVTAPLIVLLYDRVFLADSVRDLVRRRWGLHAALSATWLILWICGIASSVFNTSNAVSRVGFGFQGISPVDYLLTQPGVILCYLRLAVWPHPLCLDYAWPVADSAIAIAGPALMIGLLGVAVVWAFRRAPLLGFAGACFFLILGPTSSFIPIRDPLFEHRMYLPLAGVIVVVVALGHWALKRLTDARRLSSRTHVRIASGLVLLIAAALGTTTIRRNRDYRSQFGMWMDIAAKRPNNARAQVNLASGLLRHPDRLDEVITHVQRALRIDPTIAVAHENLGKALFRQGRVGEAIESLRRAAALSPKLAGPHFGLAVALDTAGRLSEAVESYRTVLRLQPDHPDVQRALARALARQQQSKNTKGF